MKKHPSLKYLDKAEPWPQEKEASTREALRHRRPSFWRRVMQLRPMPWGWLKQLKASKLYREFRARWMHRDDAQRDDVWDNAEALDARIGLILAGDCDDFVAELARVFMRAGFPREALVLIICTIGRDQGHAVLGIETSHGTLIACNIAGLCWLDDPRLQNHHLRAARLPDGTWRKLRPPHPTLADLMERGATEGS